MKQSNISVVIRTRDKEKYLDRLLETLTNQTLVPNEIIIVNNFSSDEKLENFKNSLKFFTKIKIKLINIADDKFSHPYSTNIGVHASENELVCITNAHSLPISYSWLENGIKHFKHPNVACISGFFFPLQKRKMNYFIYYISEKIVLSVSRPCSRWTTINCIIRKSLWQGYPFDENLSNIMPETKRYGLEDYDWSREMKAREFKVIIDPLFSVYHSHESGIRELYRNLKNYFTYRRIQRKIDGFKRPRRSYSKVL